MEVDKKVGKYAASVASRGDRLGGGWQGTGEELNSDWEQEKERERKREPLTWLVSLACQE